MEVRVVRSAGRRKTVSAREVDGVLVVQAPADIDDAELKPIIERLHRRLARKRAGRDLDDRQLELRARELNARYFGGTLHWHSIRWVTNQDHRWGSCTPLAPLASGIEGGSSVSRAPLESGIEGGSSVSRAPSAGGIGGGSSVSRAPLASGIAGESSLSTGGTIRISHRLAALPGWVLDAVIVHELAHLLEPNHGLRFWKLAGRYPMTERARGYLMALSAEGEEAM